MENKNSFEKQLSRLEQIVSELENKSCTLDESIALFQEGIMLSKSCSNTLKNARGKITELGDDDNGDKI